jgi:hypothetical protein
MLYFLLRISFDVYVPDNENQLNYTVDERHLVRAGDLLEAQKKLLDYYKKNKQIKGTIKGKTIRIKNLTIF